MTRRVVIAISGASGAVYGIRALEALRACADTEVHLILTDAAAVTITAETNHTLHDVRRLADIVHTSRNIGASIASGSFPVTGMLVAPCSIKTLSAVATSYTDNLVARAADVMLKERRPLVLLVRETPLHLGHLRLMAQAAEAGAVIMPPVPAFYHRPRSLEEVVTHTVGRALDQLGIELPDLPRWAGLRDTPSRAGRRCG